MVSRQKYKFCDNIYYRYGIVDVGFVEAAAARFRKFIGADK